MKKLLSTLLLVLVAPLLTVAAPGEPVGIEINPDGFSGYVYFEGMGSGGTADYGLTWHTNYSTVIESGAVQTLQVIYWEPRTAGKLRIVGSTPGFLNGAEVTRKLDTYGVIDVNVLTANDPEEYFDSGTSIVRRRFALTEYVYSFDTSLTATLGSGLYAEGGTNSAGASLSVTNGSTLADFKSIGNWSYPVGWQTMTNSTWRLRTVGFHQSADEGRPLDCVQFIGTGVTSGLVVTNTVTDMTVPFDFDEPYHPGEFVCDFDVTGFTPGETVNWDFRMLPRRGTTNAILDTRSVPWSEPTAEPVTMPCVYDPLQAFGYLGANVDAAVGSDATGLVFDNLTTDPTSLSGGQFFATYAGACVKIAATNNTLYGRNNTSGATIYGRAGNYAFLGGTYTPASANTVYLTVKPYPGDTLVITNRSGSSDPGDALRMYGVDYNIAASQVPFNAINHLWIDQSDSMVSISTGPIQTCGDVWVTHSTVGSWAQGFKPSTTSQNIRFRLRGLDLNSGFNTDIHCQFVMACDHSSTNGGSYRLRSDITGQTTSQENFIVYGNVLGGHSSSVSLGSFASETNLARGGLVALTAFIKSDSTLGGPVLSVASSSTTQDTTNLWLVNVVTDGERNADMFSSGSETTTKWRIGCGVLNSVIAIGGWKDWLVPPANTNRYGNLGLLYGTGSSGNLDYESAVNTATLSFPWRAMQHSYYPSVTNILNWPQYVDRKAAPTDASGNSDVTLETESPVWELPTVKWVFPFDIHGRPTRPGGPPGVSAKHDKRKSTSIAIP